MVSDRGCAIKPLWLLTLDTSLLLRESRPAVVTISCESKLHRLVMLCAKKYLVWSIPDCDMSLLSLPFQPILASKLKLQDTCGVHNLHGMPGVLGAFLGALVAALATQDVYGDG